MRLCFIDESGTPPSKPNPKKPYFTLGAVILNAEDWRTCHNEIKEFKSREKILGELKWRYFAPENTDAANPLRSRCAIQRKSLSLGYASLIGTLPIQIIACVTDVEAAYSYASVKDQQTLYHFSYKPITERFQYYLQDVNDIGVIIADHRGRDDDKMLRAHHGTLMSQQTPGTSKYTRLIEGLFLQDSTHSTGIQIADFVTGGIHRAYMFGDGEHASYFKNKMRGFPNKILGRGLILHPSKGFTEGKGRRAGSQPRRHHCQAPERICNLHHSVKK